MLPPGAPAGLPAGGADGAPPASGPNVLLVTIDTLRADHVGCYGHARALDPGARRPGRPRRPLRDRRRPRPAHGALPRLDPHRADAPRPRLPRQRRLRAPGRRSGRRPRTSGQAGYRTAAFVSGFPLDRRFGFDRGFETYDDHCPKGNDPRRTPLRRALRRRHHRRGAALARGPRRPRRARPPLLPLGPLLRPPRALRAAGRLRRALPERALRRRGRVRRPAARAAPAARSRRRGNSPARSSSRRRTTARGSASTARVPTASSSTTRRSRSPSSWPARASPPGRVAPTVARGIDVLPTLLDYAGLKLRPELEGRSLRPAIEGREMSDAPAYAETLYPQREFGLGPALRLADRAAQDDRGAAPGALRPRGGPRARPRTAPGARTRASPRCGRSWQAALSRPAASAAAEVDPEAAERLRALGYVAGGGGARRSSPGASLRDPKDGQRLVPRLNRGMSAVRTDPATAIRDLTAVLAEDPGLLMARRSLAVAYTSAHQYERAIAELRRLEKDGDPQRRGRDRARRQPALRRPPRRGRRRPRAHRPREPALRPALDLPRRGPHQEGAGSPTPPRPTSTSSRSRPTTSRPSGGSATWPCCGRGSTRPAAATRASSRSSPRDAGAMTKLGVVRMRTGRPDEAISLFRRAIEREPKNGEALLYLAGALASTGHPAEALPFFERALGGRAAQPDGAQRPRSDPAWRWETGRGRRRRSASRSASTRSSPTCPARCPTWGVPQRGSRKPARVCPVAVEGDQELAVG